MICVHCGLCCYDYPVGIIKKEFKDLDIKSTDQFPEEAFDVKPGNTPCEHLYWENHESRCAIHDKPWYQETPCFAFGQIEESPDCICRIGEWIMEKRKTDKRFDYELKCEQFVYPKGPDELNEEFKNSREKKNRIQRT